MAKKKETVLTLFKLAVDIKKNRECLLSLLNFLKEDVHPEYREYIVKDIRKKLEK